MRLNVLLSLALSVSTTAFVFSPQPITFSLSSSLSATRLFAGGGGSGGKGFGSPQKQQQQQQQQNQPPKKQSYNEESDRTMENPNTELNMGQKALEELRRQRAEQRNAELQRVREIKSVDEYLQQTPNAAVIPEKVAMRMGSRMLPFVGLPLVGGMGAFVTFWFLATYRNMEFQPSMVAFTTIGILALGLVVRNKK